MRKKRAPTRKAPALRLSRKHYTGKLFKRDEATFVQTAKTAFGGKIAAALRAAVRDYCAAENQSPEPKTNRKLLRRASPAHDNPAEPIQSLGDHSMC